MLKTTTTALLRWRVNGFQAATTRNYALENVCIISNHGILEIEMGTFKKKLGFLRKKIHGIYASVYQWRCAIIRYPLGWNAAKIDLQKETMAECLIAVKYGKSWQMIPRIFLKIYQNLPMISTAITS